jgi:hypothetical protein
MLRPYPFITGAMADLIVEMSFLTRDSTSASVYAENPVQRGFWAHADLEKMELKNNGVYDKFIAIIGCDLVRKLKHRNDQHVDLITKLDFSLLRNKPIKGATR